MSSDRIATSRPVAKQATFNEPRGSICHYHTWVSAFFWSRILMTKYILCFQSTVGMVAVVTKFASPCCGVISCPLSVLLRLSRCKSGTIHIPHHSHPTRRQSWVSRRLCMLNHSQRQHPEEGIRGRRLTRRQLSAQQWPPHALRSADA